MHLFQQARRSDVRQMRSSSRAAAAHVARRAGHRRHVDVVDRRELPAHLHLATQRRQRGEARDRRRRRGLVEEQSRLPGRRRDGRGALRAPRRVLVLSVDDQAKKYEDRGANYDEFYDLVALVRRHRGRQQREDKGAGAHLGRPFNQLVPRLPAGDLGPWRRVRTVHSNKASRHSARPYRLASVLQPLAIAPALTEALF